MGRLQFQRSSDEYVQPDTSGSLAGFAKESALFPRGYSDFVKLRVGRFRPDFFDRCKYDAVLKACTGNASVILEGRRSFPSGHSSSAFFGCVFLLLFLAGKNRCFAYSATFPTSGILQSRLLRLIIAIAPLFLSTYVAVSRWEDHWCVLFRSMLRTLLG